MKWREVFANKYIAVEESCVDNMDGEPYYRVRNQESVICYALTPEDEVLFVKQLRPCLGRYTLELPAGGIDCTDESYLDAAVRELREETGWEGMLTEIGDGVWTCTNRHKNPDRLFIGVATQKIEGLTIEDGLEVVYVKREEVRQLLACGDWVQLTAMGLIYFASTVLGRELTSITHDELYRHVRSL